MDIFFGTLEKMTRNLELRQTDEWKAQVYKYTNIQAYKHTSITSTNIV
jgi:hypothetical protein